MFLAPISTAGWGTRRREFWPTVGESAAVVHHILVAFHGFTPLVSVFLPAAAAVAGISLLLRQLAGSCNALAESVLDAALGYSALCVAFLVFTPQRGTASRLHLELGEDVRTALAAGTTECTPWLQLAGNLLLLAPLGALVPRRISWFNSTARIAAGGLLLAGFIELVQFLLVPGRVSSVDDIVLNALGAVLGGLFARSPRRVVLSRRSAVPTAPAVESARPGWEVSAPEHSTWPERTEQLRAGSVSR